MLMEGQRSPLPAAHGRAKSPAQPGEPWLRPEAEFFLFGFLSCRYLLCMTKVLKGKSY